MIISRLEDTPIHGHVLKYSKYSKCDRGRRPPRSARARPAWPKHSGAGQMIDGHRLHNAAALRTPLRQPLLGPRGADNPPDCVRPSPGDL